MTKDKTNVENRLARLRRFKNGLENKLARYPHDSDYIYGKSYLLSLVFDRINDRGY